MIAWLALASGVVLLALGAWLEAREQDQSTGERRGRTRTRE